MVEFSYKSDVLTAPGSLDNGLNCVAFYSKVNGLKLNSIKSAILFLRLRYGGVVFDSSLGFKSQDSHVTNKSFCALRDLFKSEDLLSYEFQKKSFLNSGSVSLKLLNMEFRKHTSGIPCIYSLTMRYHVRVKLTELKWPKMNLITFSLLNSQSS